MFLFGALLDGFLNIWDERFHALVAKNMMETPFVPRLYPEMLLDIDHSHWAKSYIWMHKQPLFLWQIMLSFKLFGVSELAMRIPSILMCTILIPVIVRSGTLLVNKNVGYLAALLFASSFYTLELISGRQMLDHNDIAFAGYITLSIWSWLEYKNSGKVYWLFLIGLFSGCAVLCKWFVGLLVYLGWGTELLTSKAKLKEYLRPLLSFLVTLVIVLPWQIYTFVQFPDEASREWEYNTMHFSVPIEAHGGNSWYHLSQIENVFGHLVPFILLIGMYLLYKRGKSKSTVVGIFAIFLGVHLFFSLAATKMPSFTYILILPVFIFVATAMDSAILALKERVKVSFIATLIILFVLGLTSYSRIDVEELQLIHTEWSEENTYTRMLTYNRKVFVELKKELPPNSVLLNVKGRHYVEAMFYTDALAYNFVPSVREIQKLKSANKHIYIFESETPLPEYITSDSDITILKKRLQGYE